MMIMMSLLVLPPMLLQIRCMRSPVVRVLQLRRAPPPISSRRRLSQSATTTLCPLAAECSFRLRLGRRLFGSRTFRSPTCTRARRARSAASALRVPRSWRSCIVGCGCRSGGPISLVARERRKKRAHLQYLHPVLCPSVWPFPVRPRVDRLSLWLA